MPDETKWEWVLVRLRDFGDALIECEYGWEAMSSFRARKLTQLQAVPNEVVPESWKMQYIPYIPMAFKIIPLTIWMTRETILWFNKELAKSIPGDVTNIWSKIEEEQSDIEIAREGSI